MRYDFGKIGSKGFEATDLINNHAARRICQASDLRLRAIVGQKLLMTDKL